MVLLREVEIISLPEHGKLSSLVVCGSMFLSIIRTCTVITQMRSISISDQETLSRQNSQINNEMLGDDIQHFAIYRLRLFCVQKHDAQFRTFGLI